MKISKLNFGALISIKEGCENRENCSNFENAENNSVYLKVLSCNPSQLTFLMTLGYHAIDYNLDFYCVKRG